MVDVICPPLSIAKSTLIGWREYYGRGGVGVDGHLCGAPSKREELSQYCFNICPPPTALDQHWNNIGSSLRVWWESCLHFDTREPSVSGWNRLHSALCRDEPAISNFPGRQLLPHSLTHRHCSCEGARSVWACAKLTSIHWFQLDEAAINVIV